MTENPRIREEIQRAYEKKGEGENGAALRIFEALEPEVRAYYGQESEAMASLLDDQASCYLRGGEHDRARHRYNRAAAILEKRDRTNTRLYAGIQRRLKTIEALEAAGIQCDEPLAPAPGVGAAADADAGEALPYFPSLESLHSAFWAMRHEMTGCVEKSAGAIPIWCVVTNDGRVLLPSVRSDAVSRQQARCLEEKLAKAAVAHRDKLPRFEACYRNFTYPVVFRTRETITSHF